MLTLKPLWGYLAYNRITLKELARRSGLSYQALVFIKRDNTMSKDSLDKICTCLNLRIDQVMRYDED